MWQDYYDKMTWRLEEPFLLVTKEDDEYVLNILEPHRQNEDDNYSKADSEGHSVAAKHGELFGQR